jgi:hypothetical protein
MPSDGELNGKDCPTCDGTGVVDDDDDGTERNVRSPHPSATNERSRAKHGKIVRRPWRGIAAGVAGASMSKQTPEQKISAVLGNGKCSSADLAELVIAVEAAIAAADRTAEEQNAKALDIAVADARACRDAAFRHCLGRSIHAVMASITGSGESSAGCCTSRVSRRWSCCCTDCLATNYNWILKAASSAVWFDLT